MCKYLWSEFGPKTFSCSVLEDLILLTIANEEKYLFDIAKVWEWH